MFRIFAQEYRLLSGLLKNDVGISSFLHTLVEGASCDFSRSSTPVYDKLCHTISHIDQGYFDLDESSTFNHHHIKLSHSYRSRWHACLVFSARSCLYTANVYAKHERSLLYVHVYTSSRTDTDAEQDVRPNFLRFAQYATSYPVHLFSIADGIEDRNFVNIRSTTRRTILPSNTCFAKANVNWKSIRHLASETSTSNPRFCLPLMRALSANLRYLCSTITWIFA